MRYDTLVFLLEEGVYAIGFISAGEMLCRYFIEGIEYEVSMEEWQYETVGDLSLFPESDIEEGVDYVHTHNDLWD